MDFYINKGATLPRLVMELINDGRNDYGNFHDKIQNAVIAFCMTDSTTGVKRIGNKPAVCILKEPSSDCIGEEYFIGYNFTEKDTKKVGSFTGVFTIVFNDGSGTLTVPIKDDLNIHVLNP